MLPVSTLCDEYIDRRKLTEQKKPFEYIVPPPSRGVGTIKRLKHDGLFLDNLHLPTIDSNLETIKFSYQKNILIEIKR